MVDNLQNQKDVTEENPVSVESKQGVVENVPVVEETPVVVANEQVEIPEVVETTKEAPIVKEINEDAGLPRSEELAETKEEETQPTTPTQEVEQPQPIEPIQQTQETPQAQKTEDFQPTEEIQPTNPAQEIESFGSPRFAREDERVVEKIIYKTPPNLIQNLLNKARARIQERKRKKLDKIMSLFESNSEISNSDIQKLLRTTKRSATRYLNILEKEQKIIQVGVKGRGVKYVRK